MNKRSGVCGVMRLNVVTERLQMQTLKQREVEARKVIKQLKRQSELAEAQRTVISRLHTENEELKESLSRTLSHMSDASRSKVTRSVHTATSANDATFRGDDFHDSSVGVPAMLPSRSTSYDH
ncbi:MAG: hypothetical protein MHM6MM_004329 [Cercozoa sp. M6MM]